MATKVGIIIFSLFFFLFSFHVLFSQKRFAYDFEFLHTFLSNKKIRFSKKNQGGHPFTHQLVIPGWTAGGVRALWVIWHPRDIQHGDQFLLKIGQVKRFHFQSIG